MAAGRKEYELLMKLTAALGPNFGSTFKTAIGTTKKLQDSLQKIQEVQKKTKGYENTQNAISLTKNKLKELEKQHDGLQRELSQTIEKEKNLQKALEDSEKATGKGTAEYKQIRSELKETQREKEKLTEKAKKTAAEIDNAAQKIGEQEKKLITLSSELKDAGVKTDKLAEKNKKLQKAYDRVKESQEDLAKVNSRIDENKAAISATKTELAKTVAVVAGAGTAFAVPIKGAMEFESSMAEVSKVVDWIGNGNNATAEQIQQYSELSDGLYGLTRQIPMTAQEFAEITAAAGQANVAMDNEGLLAFASDAAKMGIAFDVSAEQAGQFMAQWRTAFGMTQSDVVELSDVINYLGNTTPATAAQISDVVTRIGPLGEVAGLTSKDLAALGAAIVGVGIDESVAATGIKNLMLDMTKGTAATKKMNGVLESMGMSSADLAERMQTDATGAIMDFMQAVKQLPEAEQAAALTTYFGQESVAAIAPLLSNLDNLEAQFQKAGNASQYAGSMEAEYAARAETSENSLAIFKNAVKELSDTFGKVFVPDAESGVQAITEMIYKVTDFVKENPELIKTLTTVAGGLAAVKVGSLAGMLGFLKMKGGVLETAKTFLGFKANHAEVVAKTVTGGGKIAAMGKSMTGYFGGIKTAFGGVGGSIDKLFGGKLSGLFSKMGSGISNGILKPLSGLSGKVFSTLGGFAGRLTGFFGGIAQKIAAGPLGKIGGVFGNLGKTAGAVLGGPLKGLGSLFGGLFGKAMPVILILSALSALFLKLSGEDISSFIEPLREAFEQIKPVLASVIEQFVELGKQLLPTLVETAKQLAPLLGQIITAILPIVLQLIQGIVPLIMELVRQLLPAILNIIATLAPLLTQIITAVLPIVLQLLETLMPIITQLVTSVLPIIVDVLNMLMPVITELINAVLPVLMTILEALMPVIQVLADLFGTVLGAAIEGIKPIIEAVMKIFGGLIDFITGIFTGNWEKAWEGVKNIFKGIVDGLVGVFKFPINLIIEGINFFLGGLNKLKVPDWVPGIGGKGINIPLIPKLEKGSGYTPDTFIAGDVNGKGGELVTGARGRKVFTAAETNRVLTNIRTAEALQAAAGRTPIQLQKANNENRANIRTAEALQAAAGRTPAQLQRAYSENPAAAYPGVAEPPKGVLISFPEPRRGGDTFTIQYSPTIHIDGNRPADLEEKLKQNNENLLQMFRDFLRQQRENEERTRYA